MPACEREGVRSRQCYTALARPFLRRLGCKRARALVWETSARRRGVHHGGRCDVVPAREREGVRSRQRYTALARPFLRRLGCKRARALVWEASMWRRGVSGGCGAAREHWRRPGARGLKRPARGSLAAPHPPVVHSCSKRGAWHDREEHSKKWEGMCRLHRCREGRSNDRILY